MRAGEKRHCRTACTARSFKPGRQPAQNLDVADGAVAAHDDLELDFTRDVGAACFVGVVRLHFAQQAWRLDAAAGAVRTAAGAAARSVANAGCRRLRRVRCRVPSRRRRPCPSPGSAALPAPSPARLRDPAVSAGLITIGAITGGSCLASSGFGGSGGFGAGLIGGGNVRAGMGLLIFAMPLRCAFGGGVLNFMPPPPPPPPGPGRREEHQTDRLVLDRLGALVGHGEPQAGDKQDRARPPAHEGWSTRSTARSWRGPSARRSRRARGRDPWRRARRPPFLRPARARREPPLHARQTPPGPDARRRSAAAPRSSGFRRERASACTRASDTPAAAAMSRAVYTSGGRALNMAVLLALSQKPCRPVVICRCPHDQAFRPHFTKSLRPESQIDLWCFGDGCPM